MKLKVWFGQLYGKQTANFIVGQQIEYPVVQLLPRPSYRLLLPPDRHVSTGWLLRRTKGKNAFTVAQSGRQIIHDPKQLCDEPKHLGEGFSVSLWGRFKLPHNGWKNTKEGQAKIFEPWTPPQPSEPPTAEEMYYLPPDTWDVVSFDIAKLNGCEFNVTGFGLFYSKVHHAPNCWNYWHYEVRFKNDQGQWLHKLKEYDPIPYKNKRLQRLHEGLLASFIQAGLAKTLNETQAPAPLRRTFYDSRPPWWARMFRR